MEKRKIRVLMMVSWYTPHHEELKTGIFHNEQAVDLAKHCHMAIYWPYDSTLDVCCTKHKDWGIVTYRSRYDIRKKFRNRTDMYRSMKRIVKEFHPDLIHAQVATEAGRFAVALGRLFHIPVMITEHSAPEGSEVDHFPHYYYAKFAYGGSKYNACVSDYLTGYLRKLFPKYRFETIYNGIVEQGRGMPVERKSEDKKIPSCAIVANFYHKEIKGFHVLLPVLARLKKEDRPLCLHLVGDGEYLEYYKKEAERLGVLEDCVFHGHCSREEVNRVLDEADFLVSASLFESFGCSIAEALMAGLPVVATACGGPNSLVGGDNGILVEKGSVEALYDGICTMMQSYGSYDREKIRTQAAEKFSLCSVTGKYLKVYEQVLKGQKGAKERRR